MPETPVTIDTIEIADEPARWAALGFDVADGVCQVGGVRLRLGGADTGAARGVADARMGAGAAGGIVGWSLRGVASAELDGLATTISDGSAPAPAGAHSNGVVAIDHVVAASPDLDRTVAALSAAGLDLRRVREQPTPAGAPRQAFFRLGEAILEVIQEPAAVIERAGGPAHPARFWGLALVAADVDATAARLAPHVGEARAAVQEGRRIASVRRSAGLTVPLALMSPRPSRLAPAAARR